jgi:uncharacterized protein (TIGR02246 family)
MRLLVFASAVCVLFVSSCSQPAPPAETASKPDLAAEAKAIREIDAKWLQAAQARDAATPASFFAEDGVAYPAHTEPVVGPAAVQADIEKRNAENPKRMVTWSTDAIHVAESGELAVQSGRYEMTNLGPKGDREDRGRFVTVWKKVNGQWKVAHDIGSTTMPETPPKK